MPKLNDRKDSLMYYLYCTLIALYMGMIYEATGLSGLTLQGLALSSILLFALQLILNLPKGRHPYILGLNFICFHFLVIANLLKVRFQLSEITLFDFKLIENTASVAHLFLNKVPFKEIGFLIVLGLAAFLFFNYLYEKEFRKIVFLKFRKLPLAIIIFILPFILQAQGLVMHSSFFHLADSGKVAIELLLNDTLNLSTAQADVKKHPLSNIDNKDVLLKNYPFDTPKKIDLVIIQSETFFDAKKNQKNLGKDGIVIKEDITKVFQEYQKKGISGELFVPTVGGATVNTEYEAMTGYSAKAFAKGSIVFTSILKDKTSSLADFMKDSLGNTKAIGIHNHTRSYWDRDRVYPLLSIDEYIDMEGFSLEAQNDLVGAWMSDKTLFDKTLEVLSKDEEKNHLILSVTSQNHGPFLEKRGEAVGIEHLPEEDIWEITNYFTNLKYSDDELKAFMEVIDKRKTPTIVVFYGDHKPDPKYKIFTDSDYYTKDEYQNLYTTDYFIYFNPMIKDKKLLALKGIRQDLSAPSLNRYLQILLGDTSKESLFIYNVTKNKDNYFSTEKEDKIANTLYNKLSRQAINSKNKPWQKSYYHLY